MIDPIEHALDAPWVLLRHDGDGDHIVRAQALSNIEDAGRTEDRVRHDYTGRYPLELLQNAHDAAADSGRSGAVRFAVTNSALIIANEGVPFTSDRIRSLVRLGSSEKVLNRVNRRTIGYKGVGFTAVFEITDCPQIISATVAFGFDRKRAQREVRKVLGISPSIVPARGFPFRLEAEAWAEDAEIVHSFIGAGATTIIRLPLRANRTIDEISQHITETISPETLLFMPYVSGLEVLLPGGTERWTKMIGHRSGTGKLIRLKSTSGDAHSWLVTRASINVPRDKIDALEDPLWFGLRQLEVAVALPWRKGPDPNVGVQKLHVYFPTDDELGRALLIHGDFYIDSSRRHIESEGPGGDVSRLVAAAAAKLAAQLAESKASQGGRPLLECFAQTKPVGGFGSTMGELIEEALRSARIARPADGSGPRRPSELARLGLTSARRGQSILQLLDVRKDLVKPGDDEGVAGSLLERLGAQTLSNRDIAVRVNLSKAGLGYASGLRILARWLAGLNDVETRTVVAALRGCLIVQDTQQRWRFPRDVIIHQPDSPELPSRLRKAELALPTGAAIKGLLRALGIPELSTAAALEIVIKAVREQGFGERSSEAIQLHTFMRGAWKQARHEVEARRRHLALLPVPAKKMRGSRIEWKRAGKVYFSSQWTKNKMLETLYGRFGQSEFLARGSRLAGSTFESEATFYRTLGVAKEPRMKKYVGTHTQTWLVSREFSHWRSLNQVRAALACHDGHPQTARQINFASLDRLDDILTKRDRETNATLARYLSSKEDPFGTDAEIYCTHNSHRGSDKRKYAIGYQRWRLQTTAWIPVKNDPSGAAMRPPDEAWTGTRLPRWLMVPQARLNVEIARKLHLINSDRPSVAAIERALRDLNHHFPDLAGAIDDVKKSAEWLLKRLDRALQRSQGTQGPIPPLPCTTERHMAWSTSPLIADLTGLDFFPSLYILPIGVWTGLRRGYDLKRASEIVKQELELGDRIRAPGLFSRDQKGRLAAVLAAQGADENKVATRLARLRETPITYIQLRYSFNGQPASGPVQRPFHLKIHRNRANRVTGASLFVSHPIPTTARINLGRELAGYLEASELHASIGLFLTDSAAVVETENLSPDDIAEGSRRVESHRRGRDYSDLSSDEMLDPLADISSDEEEEHKESESGPAQSRDPQAPARSKDSESDAVEAERPLPPLIYDEVLATDVRGKASPLINKPFDTRKGPGTGSAVASGGKIDWARLDRDRRLYGRRGEEAAFESERRRLAELGVDSKFVKWVSRDAELSTYDIESLNDDGSPRYIEVKATVANDPSEPFKISTAELRFAFQHRREYFIYRVTDVRSAVPRIYRYRDPLGELEAQRGHLTMSKALMVLSEPEDK